MTDKTEQNEIEITPGLLIKQARERQGLSIRDVADSLNLRPAIIEQLELDQYEKMGHTLYIKGYLKACARLLYIDEQELSDLYDTTFAADDNKKQKMKSFSRRTKQEAHDNRLMFVTYVILIVSFIFIFIWWWQNFSGPTSEQTSNANETTSQAILPNVTAGVEKISSSSLSIDTDTLTADNQPLGSTERTHDPISSDAALVESGIDNADVVPASVKIESQDTIKQEVVIEEPVAVNNDSAPNLAVPIIEPNSKQEVDNNRADIVNNLDETSLSTMTAVEMIVDVAGGDCWLEIRDATGEIMANGLKRQGKTMTLIGEPPFSVKLGAPENIAIEYNGEDVDMSQFKSGRTANFSLPLED
jgi:cytoskeleton protein RodZ